MRILKFIVSADAGKGRLCRLWHAAAFISALMFLPKAVVAATTTAGIAEWETPLTKVVTSITGPVAFGISVIGLVAAGSMLIWGGEINEFTRKIIMLVLVLGLIVASVNLLSTLFGVGALVT